MNHDRLLPVSVAGLLVNLVGIFVFQHGGHGHSHGGDEGSTSLSLSPVSLCTSISLHDPLIITLSQVVRPFLIISLFKVPALPPCASMLGLKAYSIGVEPCGDLPYAPINFSPKVPLLGGPPSCSLKFPQAHCLTPFRS